MSKISKNVPYHSEQLWALIKEESDSTTSMMYTLAPTRKQIWSAVIDSDFYGTGYTKERLQAQGWVARRVFVEERS